MLRTELAERRIHRGGIQDVDLAEAISVSGVDRWRAVEAQNPRPALQEILHQIGADEARTARDQNATYHEDLRRGISRV